MARPVLERGRLAELVLAAGKGQGGANADHGQATGMATDRSTDVPGLPRGPRLGRRHRPRQPQRERPSPSPRLC